MSSAEALLNEPKALSIRWNELRISQRAKRYASKHLLRRQDPRRSSSTPIASDRGSLAFLRPNAPATITDQILGCSLAIGVKQRSVTASRVEGHLDEVGSESPLANAKKIVRRDTGIPEPLMGSEEAFQIF